MSAKFTSGPWEAGEYGNSFIVTAKDRVYDVAVVRNIGNEDNAANASLIAAAPDLFAALEACEMRLTHLAQDGASVAYELKKARAALALARGEA